jgi:tripartite-type tricarboxylate transporter receptor subunit TctC
MKHLVLPIALLVAANAFAQDAFPTHSVTMVVPFAPGGGTDTGARIIAQKLGQKWGQPVVVDNRGGAAGMVGADYVAKAKPDGYTIMMGNIGTQAINPSLYKKMAHDPATAFAPISLVAELPLVMLVNPEVPAKTVKEFIAYAKSQPGKLSYSTSGAGSSMHLAAEMFKSGSDSVIVHVPYRGGGPAITDLIAGHVQLSFATVLESIGHIKSGRLRALAVTGDKRVSALPDVPTMSEAALPGYNSISWIGLVAPAATPKDIVDKISSDVREVLATDEVKAKLTDLGAIPAGDTPAQFQQLIANDRQRYQKVISEKNITAE